MVKRRAAAAGVGLPRFYLGRERLRAYCVIH
jgi:hypothetical protein